MGLEAASVVHAVAALRAGGTRPEAFRASMTAASEASRISARHEAFELYQRAIDNMPGGPAGGAEQCRLTRRYADAAGASNTTRRRAAAATQRASCTSRRAGRSTRRAADHGLRTHPAGLAARGPARHMEPVPAEIEHQPAMPGAG